MLARMLSPSARTVADALRAAGASGEPRVFTEPVPTAAAAAAVLGCPVAAIANSLVFDADGEPVLVLASGAARVDPALVAGHLGVPRLRRASPEFVLEHTGQEVGGVAPVGHPRPLRAVVDTDLAAHDVLWAGAGDRMTVFPTTFAELVELTRGTPAPVR